MNLRRASLSIVAFIASLAVLLSFGDSNRSANAAPIPKEVKKLCPACNCKLTSDTGYIFGGQLPLLWDQSVLEDGMNITTYITAHAQILELIHTTAACDGNSAALPMQIPTQYKIRSYWNGAPDCTGVLPEDSLVGGSLFSDPQATLSANTKPSYYCPTPPE